ncbi:GNAT family N-acetyltransferase [Gryllotalpicola reticulitermitis]|uniref:GNAT family N-acetyltransferase n=1 Tax=Gryllotalpicola reticulitermitis TaxID=1184153 RepID=A0ABV8Q7I6_9MICO
MSIETVERRSGPDARRILDALPDWFGDPVAVDNYVAAAEDTGYGSIVAVHDGAVVGIALTRRHFHESAELHLIAVHPRARGRGVGRLLVERVSSDLEADGCVMLSVHTVGPSFDNAAYAQTRGFYRKVGFTPLEEHDGLDWPGPTLILVRPLLGPRRRSGISPAPPRVAIPDEECRPE